MSTQAKKKGHRWFAAFWDRQSAANDTIPATAAYRPTPVSLIRWEDASNHPKDAQSNQREGCEIKDQRSSLTKAKAKSINTAKLKMSQVKLITRRMCSGLSLAIAMPHSTIGTER